MAETVASNKSIKIGSPHLATHFFGFEISYKIWLRKPLMFLSLKFLIKFGLETLYKNYLRNSL